MRIYSVSTSTTAYYYYSVIKLLLFTLSKFCPGRGTIIILTYFLGEFLYTCSTDKTLSIWDTQVGVRVRKLRGHTSYVNALHPARRGPQLVVSAGDDSTVRLWDARRKTPVKTLQDHYQLTAISFNDTADQVFNSSTIISGIKVTGSE